jgi:hypothetical protein
MLEPVILSLGSAAVCAADFLPLRLGIENQDLIYICKDNKFYNLKFQ